MDDPQLADHQVIDEESELLADFALPPEGRWKTFFRKSPPF
jgi:hypothetical protein